MLMKLLFLPLWCVLCELAGDPHASERIGPSCSRAQLGISVSQLVAAVKGAQSKDIALIQVVCVCVCTRASN